MSGRVKVLETDIVHATDVIYWLDGTSGIVEADMQRIAEPLLVSFTIRPSDLQVVHGPGRMAVWRRPTGPMVEGEATEADKTASAGLPVALAGSVADPAGRYHPRRFRHVVGTGVGHAVQLFPAPVATRFGKAGGLRGTLRSEDTGQPVPWALLTLEVEIVPGTRLCFRAQANADGDFAIALTQLPPLPQSIAAYPAELRIDAPADAATPADPDEFIAMEVQAQDTGLFSAAMALAVVPGEIRQLRSFDRTFVAVRTA
jgi:hypothetical protein